MESPVRSHTCIYCRLEKPASEFNIEHVVPRAFGTFEQNLTLKNTVCTACNTYFSKELEPHLARDGAEGYERFEHGLKPPSEFKSLGARATSRVQIPSGHFAGAWGRSIPGEERLGVELLPQIGFATTAEGPFEWFALDGLPSMAQLKDRGYTPPHVFVRTCECEDQGEVTRAMAAAGFGELEWGDTFDPPTGRQEVELVFKVGERHQRCLAKIAFNYLAHQHGAEAALWTGFDEIREFIRHGVRPTGEFFIASTESIVPETKLDGKRSVIHLLTVEQITGQFVRGQVSLYNRFRWSFVLGDGEFPGGLEPRGHYFDPFAREIVLLRYVNPAGSSTTPPTDAGRDRVGARPVHYLVRSCRCIARFAARALSALLRSAR
jgi:hypothetical protein